MNKYKAVQGKSPTKAELSQWKPEQYITFLRFLELFVVEGKFSVTKDRWRTSERFLEEEGHPFQEFLYRINFFTFNKDASERKFMFKLTGLMRVVLGYLRANPSLITDKIREILESNPKFKWVLSQHKVVQTESGMEVVVPDIRIPSSKDPDVSNPASVHLQLVEAQVLVINLLTRLAKSIQPKDIMDMNPKDRFMAIGRLLEVYNISNKLKPTKNVFKQLNISTANREELEAALLAFNKDE